MFHRPAPHTYTVEVEFGGIRIDGRHHTLSEACRYVVEAYASTYRADETRVALVKRALSRLVHNWRTMGRPDAMRIAKCRDIPVRVNMVRV